VPDTEKPSNIVGTTTFKSNKEYTKILDITDPNNVKLITKDYFFLDNNRLNLKMQETLPNWSQLKYDVMDTIDSTIKNYMDKEALKPNLMVMMSGFEYKVMSFKDIEKA